MRAPSRLVARAAMACATCVALLTPAAAQYTPAQYDLSDLPSYQPEQMALGVVRIYGTPLEDLVGRWEPPHLGAARPRGRMGGQAHSSARLRCHVEQLGGPDRARSVQGRPQVEPRIVGRSARRYLLEGARQDARPADHRGRRAGSA